MVKKKEHKLHKQFYFILKIYLLFIYLIYFWLHWVQLQQARPSLRHAGYLIAARGLFVVARWLLPSCGVWVFSLQFCCMGSRAHGLCSLQHTGSLAEACKLNCCGMPALLSCGMWDLSSLTRDQTHIPCIVRWILYHWTTREVPYTNNFKGDGKGAGNRHMQSP